MKDIPREFIVNAFAEVSGGKSFPSSEAPRVVRSLGLAPSLKDIERFVSKGREVTLESLTEWIAELAVQSEQDSFQNLVRLLEPFDSRKTGMVPSSVLKMLLTECGERLTEEEYTDILGDFVGKDEVNYRTLIQKLLSVG